MADQLGEYQTTSMAQEERLAWLRYQRESRKEDVSDQSAKRHCQSSMERFEPPRLDESMAANGIWTQQVQDHISNHPWNDLDNAQYQQPSADERQDEEML